MQGGFFDGRIYEGLQCIYLYIYIYINAWEPDQYPPYSEGEAQGQGWLL